MIFVLVDKNRYLVTLDDGSQTTVITKDGENPEDVLKEATRPREDYREKRAMAYPSVIQQLDMIYHDFEGWRKTIKAIKDKFPK